MKQLRKMSDIAEDMRRAAELRGYTYSSVEIWGLLGRGADEIDRVRAERDFARNAVLSAIRIVSMSASYWWQSRNRSPPCPGRDGGAGD